MIIEKIDMFTNIRRLLGGMQQYIYIDNYSLYHIQIYE